MIIQPAVVLSIKGFEYVVVTGDHADHGLAIRTAKEIQYYVLLGNMYSDFYHNATIRRA